MTPDVDVLIIGAGLSGVGAACHLRRRLPDRTFTILEARGDLGGTWDLFRYPGIRSDSDMFTFGYAFEPWVAPNGIADGAAILDYIRATAQRYGVTDEIQFHRRVTRVEWNSDEAMWTVLVEHTDTGERSTITCSFLWGCTGYYHYDHGYRPQFPGLDTFAGTVVEPQQWPADLDWTDRRVVVVGSGATAVTLVPALAEHAGHVTMLQRSPSHIAPRPSVAAFDQRVQQLLPTRMAFPLLRWKHLLVSQFTFELSRRRPELVRRAIREEQAKILPADYPFDPHLTPTYDPWDQRVCLAADGDFFHAIAAGRADIVTGTIDRFTADGIRLTSGAEVPADIVVLATGLRLLAVGGIELVVDGRDIAVAEQVSYKGAMLSQVPNFVFTVGYTNASWTLKADIVADYVVRLLRFMDRHGYDEVLPVAPPEGAAAPILDLKSGYVLRALAELPGQGDKPPWRLHQNYPRDRFMLRHGRMRDAGVRFLRQRTKSGSRRSMNDSSSDRSASSSSDPSASPASSRA